MSLGPTSESSSSSQPLITMSSPFRASLELCSIHRLSSGVNIPFWRAYHVQRACKQECLPVAICFHRTLQRSIGPLFSHCPTLGSSLQVCNLGGPSLSGPSISAYKCRPRLEGTLWDGLLAGFKELLISTLRRLVRSEWWQAKLSPV